MRDTVHTYVAEKEEAEKRVKSLLAVTLYDESLTDYQRGILLLTLVGLSSEQIALDYGCTKQSIQQVRRKAWEKIYRKIPGAVQYPDWASAMSEARTARRRLGRELR